MKKIASATASISSSPEEVWRYISDFSNAKHQVIAVKDTKIIGGNQRIVSFKNGHQVSEKLLENVSNKIIHWKQEGQKGFVPIKNTEVKILLAPEGKSTKLTFTFHYDTIMGPIGWMMNMMMVKSKLTGIAQSNVHKIQKHFIA